MSTLEEQLQREIQEHGEGSPVAQILRDQIRAQKSGKSFQSLYLEKEPEASDPPSEPGSKATGSLTWLGWQEFAEEAPQPVSILYGRNIRK